MKKGDTIQKGEDKATVVWVIDGTAAIKLEDGTPRIFELVSEPEWVVIQEGIPTYQSSVENLSDEDLRKAIEDLRAQRSFITTKPKRVSTRTVGIDKNDPMAMALASMPEDKKIELMKKLGMID